MHQGSLWPVACGMWEEQTTQIDLGFLAVPTSYGHYTEAMTPAPPLPDMLGTSGAPSATLRAVLTRFQGSELTGARLILLTDTQGQRSRARYAGLVELGGEVIALISPAFGPHYSAAGTAALTELVQWAQSQDMALRETVVGGPQMNNLSGEPELAELAQLVASSSPIDAGIYLTQKNVLAGL